MTWSIWAFSWIQPCPWFFSQVRNFVLSAAMFGLQFRSQHSLVSCLCMSFLGKRDCRCNSILVIFIAPNWLRQNKILCCKDHLPSSFTAAGFKSLTVIVQVPKEACPVLLFLCFSKLGNVALTWSTIMSAKHVLHGAKNGNSKSRSSPWAKSCLPPPPPVWTESTPSPECHPFERPLYAHSLVKTFIQGAGYLGFLT